MMASRDSYNVLFLCTGNSARSVMAEAILNRKGGAHFKAFSAGSHPAGEVNPNTLRLLKNFGFDTTAFRSKSWDEFASADAPQMDFVITVCDNAAGEVCPIWPGQPMSAHWGFPDPAAFEGSEAQVAAFFAEIYGQIERRIDIFINLPLATLNELAIKREIDKIGQSQKADA